MSWIQGNADDPADICAHGRVEFRIGNEILMDPAAGPGVTVSAAGLYLLRTLSEPRSAREPGGEPLFPCCGFIMYDLPDERDVVIQGCSGGTDFEVLHGSDGAYVLVRSGDGREWLVTRSDWQAAVFEFVDLVSRFYAAHSPKRPSPDDAAGFRRFAAEWKRRRGRELGVVETVTRPSVDRPI